MQRCFQSITIKERKKERRRKKERKKEEEEEQQQQQQQQLQRTITNIWPSFQGWEKIITLLGDSGGVVNSLDFCPASLNEL